MTISYDAMLEAIARGGSTPFRLVYVVAQGPKQGQTREFVVFYGAPRPNAIGHQTNPESSRQPRKRHIDSGNLPFTEFGTKRLITLFSYNITHFNGRQVIS